MSFAVTVRHRP